MVLFKFRKCWGQQPNIMIDEQITRFWRMVFEQVYGPLLVNNVFTMTRNVYVRSFKMGMYCSHPSNIMTSHGLDIGRIMFEKVYIYAPSYCQYIFTMIKRLRKYNLCVYIFKMGTYWGHSPNIIMSHVLNIRRIMFVKVSGPFLCSIFLQ